MGFFPTWDFVLMGFYPDTLLRYNLRVTPIVYRLIGATIKGNFSMIPSFFKIETWPYILNIAGQSLMVKMIQKATFSRDMFKFIIKYIQILPLQKSSFIEHNTHICMF